MSEENDDVCECPEWDLVMDMPDSKKYIGKYVSVVEGEIAAIGDSGEEVYLAAVKKRKDCNSIPFVIRIPEGGHMLLAAS